MAYRLAFCLPPMTSDVVEVGMSTVNLGKLSVSAHSCTSDHGISSSGSSSSFAATDGDDDDDDDDDVDDDFKDDDS